MKNKYFCWLFLLFTLVSLGASAQVKVEGSVFDEMDNPLIGVSVFTENRKTGAVTDVDGHFTITVPNTKVSLTFSYVPFFHHVFIPRNGNIILNNSSQEFEFGGTTITAP